MKTKIAPQKNTLKSGKANFKKYSGIDAALINLGIRFAANKNN